jgi:hypothetical protein
VTCVMKLLSSSSISRVVRFTRWKMHGQVWGIRGMSSTYEAYAESLAKRKLAEEGSGERRLSFTAMGMDATFVKALQKAFPNVQEPTVVQEKLIPEILSGKDILLKDATGTGK